MAINSQIFDKSRGYPSNSHEPEDPDRALAAGVAGLPRELLFHEIWWGRIRATLRNLGQHSTLVRGGPSCNANGKGKSGSLRW